MCEPTTIAIASLVSSGLGVYSQVEAGRANHAIAQANANAQEQAAKDTLNAGNAQAATQRNQAKQFASRQAATLAASGTDLSSGSALDIFGDTAEASALDAMTTINNAQRQAAGMQFQAGVSRLEGKMKKHSANMGAFSTLLNAPLKAYGAYKTTGGTWSPFAKKPE